MSLDKNQLSMVFVDLIKMKDQNQSIVFLKYENIRNIFVEPEDKEIERFIYV